MYPMDEADLSPVLGRRGDANGLEPCLSRRAGREPIRATLHWTASAPTTTYQDYYFQCSQRLAGRSGIMVIDWDAFNPELEKMPPEPVNRAQRRAARKGKPY
jgi:hypothetical protein